MKKVLMGPPSRISGEHVGGDGEDSPRSDDSANAREQDWVDMTPEKRNQALRLNIMKMDETLDG